MSASARLGISSPAAQGSTPDSEGIHYSDLFEQFLPVTDKPRRLAGRLAAGILHQDTRAAPGARGRTRRERAQLASSVRPAPLRRIKRFANALIDGAPLRDKDRPGSDVNLLDWLRQCRRAGLYELGKAMYEKGGLNLAHLTDEQQIEAEDDFRICVRRGSDEETRPKKRQRKMKQDDDE